MEFAFFGLTEEQRKSQFLFEQTFGLRFIQNFEQRQDMHATQVNMTDEMEEMINKRNHLDLRLYDLATELFHRRVRHMEKKLGYSVEEYFATERDKNETGIDGGEFFVDEMDDGEQKEKDLKTFV